MWHDMTMSRMSGPQRDRSTPIVVARSLLEQVGPPAADHWAAHFADGIHLRVANRPVALGREAASGELAALFHDVVQLGTQFCFIWPAPDGETVLMEVDITARTQHQPIPMVIVMRALEPAPMIRDLRFYLDPSPLSLGDQHLRGAGSTRWTN